MWPFSNGGYNDYQNNLGYQSFINPSPNMPGWVNAGAAVYDGATVWGATAGRLTQGLQNVEGLLGNLLGFHHGVDANYQAVAGADYQMQTYANGAHYSAVTSGDRLAELNAQRKANNQDNGNGGVQDDVYGQGGGGSTISGYAYTGQQGQKSTVYSNQGGIASGGVLAQGYGGHWTADRADYIRKMKELTEERKDAMKDFIAINKDIIKDEKKAENGSERKAHRMEKRLDGDGTEENPGERGEAFKIQEHIKEIDGNIAKLNADYGVTVRPRSAAGLEDLTHLAPRDATQGYLTEIMKLRNASGGDRDLILQRAYVLLESMHTKTGEGKDSTFNVYMGPLHLDGSYVPAQMSASVVAHTTSAESFMEQTRDLLKQANIPVNFTNDEVKQAMINAQQALSGVAPNQNKAADPDKNKAADPDKNKAADPDKTKAADPDKDKAADPDKDKAADPDKPAPKVTTTYTLDLALDPKANAENAVYQYSTGEKHLATLPGISGVHNNQIKAVQHLLGVKEDGLWGKDTQAAFIKATGCKPEEVANFNLNDPDNAGYKKFAAKFGEAHTVKTNEPAPDKKQTRAVGTVNPALEYDMEITPAVSKLIQNVGRDVFGIEVGSKTDLEIVQAFEGKFAKSDGRVKANSADAIHFTGDELYATMEKINAISGTKADVIKQDTIDALKAALVENPKVLAAWNDRANAKNAAPDKTADKAADKTTDTKDKVVDYTQPETSASGAKIVKDSQELHNLIVTGMEEVLYSDKALGGKMREGKDLTDTQARRAQLENNEALYAKASDADKLAYDHKLIEVFENSAEMATIVSKTGGTVTKDGNIDKDELKILTKAITYGDSSDKLKAALAAVQQTLVAANVTTDAKPMGQQEVMAKNVGAVQKSNDKGIAS